MMNIIKYSSITILLFIFNTLAVETFENKIMLKVDNEIITSIDLKNESIYLTTLNPELKKLKDSEILEISKKSLIKEKIKKIEILKNIDNPKLPVKYLEEILRNIYRVVKIENLEDFKKYLYKNGLEYNYVLEKIEIEALWNELIIAKFSSKITIDKNKIKQKVENNKSKISKSFLMSEIFFEVSGEENLQDKFNMIVDTINTKGFENAALIYSVSETSKTGGKLNWVNENSLNKKLKYHLQNKNINDLTGPITVPSGFLILKINDIKKIKLEKNVEKEVAELINISKNNQLNQFSNIYFNKIKKNIKIEKI